MIFTVQDSTYNAIHTVNIKESFYRIFYLVLTLCTHFKHKVLLFLWNIYLFKSDTTSVHKSVLFPSWINSTWGKFTSSQSDCFVHTDWTIVSIRCVCVSLHLERSGQWQNNIAPRKDYTPISNHLTHSQLPFLPNSFLAPFLCWLIKQVCCTQYLFISGF